MYLLSLRVVRYSATITSSLLIGAGSARRASGGCMYLAPPPYLLVQAPWMINESASMMINRVGIAWESMI